MIPISTAALFSLYASHNLATWPAPAIFYGLSLLALALALWPLPGASRAIAAILAASWFWNGAIFHFGFFAPLNWGATIFGALFILQGLLLLWRGALGGALHFAWGGGLSGLTGAALIAFALLYPLLDLAAGHGWPQMQLPGTLPAPTVLITLGLLLLTRERAARSLAVLPLLWALIGGAAAAFLGIWQDVAMGLAALAGTAVLFSTRTPRA
jgi:uncharacterized protein DUF6064